MILLITKYNLSSRWLHLFTFLIFYLICIKLHYIDLNNNDFVECMMRSTSSNPENKIYTLNKELLDKDIQKHAVLLSPEEISARIEENIKQVNETTSTIEQAQQELIVKKLQLGVQDITKLWTKTRAAGAFSFGGGSRPSAEIIEKHEECVNLHNWIRYNNNNLKQSLDDLHYVKSEHTARVVEDMQTRLNMLEADVKSVSSHKAEVPEALDTSNFVTIDQLHKSHQELYTNIENNFKKELSTVSTLQTELSNEINTRKVLETRVANLEEELREIRRALMFRGTIMDPLVQQQLTLNEVKQTTQETNIAIVPR